MNIRSVLTATFIAATAIFSVVACGDDDSAGSSSSSSGNNASSGSSAASGYKQCAPTTSTCSDAELNTYNTCVQDKCAAEYNECLGPSWKSGNFAGGACSTWLSCTQKCGCGDTACTTNCGLPDSACQTCFQKFTPCQQQCTEPACYKSGTGSSTSSSSSSGSAAGKTCNDLKSCCPTLTDANLKQACEQAANSGQDISCNAAYAPFGCK